MLANANAEYKAALRRGGRRIAQIRDGACAGAHAARASRVDRASFIEILVRWYWRDDLWRQEMQWAENQIAAAADEMTHCGCFESYAPRI
jgi:hypothetical protein